MKRRASRDRDFTRFVKEVEPRLSYALAATYGPEIGSEATADALAYAWEHWDTIEGMSNPAGYLFRVGQSESRRYRRPRVLFPRVAPELATMVEPALPRALGRLTTNQRVSVLLVHGLGCSDQEAADLLGLSRSTVRSHVERALGRLRTELGVPVDV